VARPLASGLPATGLLVRGLLVARSRRAHGATIL
jgi:hypothetical protein